VKEFRKGKIFEKFRPGHRPRRFYSLASWAVSALAGRGSLRQERMKSRPTPVQMAVLEMKIDEVDDVVAEHAVDQISDDPAENKSERDLAENCSRIEVVSLKEEQ